MYENWQLSLHAVTPVRSNKLWGTYINYMCLFVLNSVLYEMVSTV
jgi:hypothetical protein